MNIYKFQNKLYIYGKQWCGYWCQLKFLHVKFIYRICIYIYIIVNLDYVGIYDESYGNPATINTSPVTYTQANTNSRGFAVYYVL